jgi:hypothetical protein
MVEIGIVEIIGIGSGLGIIGTMFIVLYFSRKQAQGFNLDIETKVLNVRSCGQSLFTSFLSGEKQYFNRIYF